MAKKCKCGAFMSKDSDSGRWHCKVCSWSTSIEDEEDENAE